MEFDKSRVYTALNADELKSGSIIVVADNLVRLEAGVERSELTILRRVENTDYSPEEMMTRFKAVFEKEEE